MEVYNVSTQIMDLFSSSYTYQRLKTQERKLGTRILLLFLHFKFKAWYVFQTYIENNWTAWSHSWPSWSWSETFWKCQLIKEWKKKKHLYVRTFSYSFVQNRHLQLAVRRTYGKKKKFVYLHGWWVKVCWNIKRLVINILILGCRVDASLLFSWSGSLRQVPWSPVKPI